MYILLTLFDELQKQFVGGITVLFSHNIANSITSYYRRNNFYYEFDEYNSIISVPIRIEDDIDIDVIEHKIMVTENGYLLYAEPDIYVEEQYRYKILVYVNLINCNLLKDTKNNFNFTFDVLTGKLGFNLGVECGDKFLSDEEINTITSVADGTIYIFGKGFFDIMYNSLPPEIAVINGMGKFQNSLSNSNNRGEDCLYTKVVGTTFDGRQEIISELNNANRLNTGHLLFLYREYDNEYDSNAVRVVHPETSKMLGYIPKDVSRTLAEKMDAGIDLIAFVESVTGGNGYNLGINIKVCVDTEGLSYLDDDDYGYGGGDFDDGIGDLNPYGLEGNDYEAWMDSYDLSSVFLWFQQIRVHSLFLQKNNHSLWKPEEALTHKFPEA